MTTTPEQEGPPPLQATADEIAGERIHQLMWRVRMPQRELADVLGIQQNALSRKLRGDRTWTLDELIAAARYLGVNVAELLPANDYAPVLSGRGRSGGSVRHQGLEPRTRWLTAVDAHDDLEDADQDALDDAAALATVSPFHPRTVRPADAAAGARLSAHIEESSPCESVRRDARRHLFLVQIGDAS